MASSLGYNNNNPPTRDHSASTKLPSAPMSTSALAERRLSVNHSHLYSHHRPQQQLNLKHQTGDQDLAPDPASAPVPSTSTNTAPASSRSVSRSPPPTSSTTINTASSIRYRECLKNHAASMGGLVVDGCGEFMPSGEEGTLQALKCAACECHRNFHRKEIEGEPQHGANSPFRNNIRRINTLPPIQHIATSLPPPQQPPPVHHQQHRFPHIRTSNVPIAPIMMNFGSGGAAAESSSEDLNMLQSNLHGQASALATSRKRFRTKFTQEQKDKMMEFAEKLDWKIQKQDEQEVQQFCSLVGVKRKVFKVWMHNNKQAMKKKQM